MMPRERLPASRVGMPMPRRGTFSPARAVREPPAAFITPSRGIVPVVSSEETREVVGPFLDRS